MTRYFRKKLLTLQRPLDSLLVVYVVLDQPILEMLLAGRLTKSIVARQTMKLLLQS